MRYFKYVQFQVSPPFTFSSNIQAIKLSDATPEVGTVGTVTGWGTFSPKDPTNYPNNLQMKEVSIMEPTECSSFTNSKTSLCTFATTGGPCDSRDPLAADGVLIGIASIISCGDNEHPDVYTDISLFRTWIRKNTGMDV